MVPQLLMILAAGLLVGEAGPAEEKNDAEKLFRSMEDLCVKAKTAEKLGPVGQGLSIEARAVVLLTAV